MSQTWRTKELPPAAARLRRGWIENNPDFVVSLYDDEASRDVVAEVAPDGLATYDAMPFPVMRADAFRYAVMVRDGGVYADIDMECLRPVERLLSGRSCVLAIEAWLTKARARELGYAAPFQVANCVFAAAPGHSFFREALARALALSAAVRSRAEVEDATGPRMLTRLFFEREWDVALASPIALTAPLHYPNLWPLNTNMHARHRAFGTWKDRRQRSFRRLWIERDRWVNPFPRALVRPTAEAFRSVSAGEVPWPAA
ncbi:glycosyltransferase family 32 protein [Alsobacter soli]|uniref:glycosyltransferase family 32 protein n=1 Tax=Alsobacter soli TaxID=2109933 RepID=UPI001304EB43|nr:glycosyltransferase [Alsobacter soli]